MNLNLLNNAAEALGELNVVFLGAATLPLWITDPAADELRPTKDIDVVVEVTTRHEFNEFEAKLRGIGFRDELTQVGRFIFGSEGVVLDVIPADASLLGFENFWQRESIPVSLEILISGSLAVRVIPPPNLLATKLEAFQGRGKGDLFGSKDFEDIVRLVDGREELVGEVENADPRLRRYLADQINNLRDNSRFAEACAAHVDPGESGELRSSTVTIPRIRAIAKAGESGAGDGG